MKNWKEKGKDTQLAIRICFLLVALWGVAMTFLVPPGNTPDESMHIDQIRTGFGHLFLIRRLPAAIGIGIGDLLRLPEVWTLQLGELCGLAGALFICWWAVKLMPIRKELLLLVMALPMTVHQIASIGHDAVLIPMCFLFVAHIFYMRCVREQLQWREVILTLAMILYITYIKPPYIFLILLTFLLPKEKIHLRVGKRFEIDVAFIKKWRIPAAILVILLILVGCFVMRENLWVRLMVGMLQEPKRTLELFLVTAYGWRELLLTSLIGEFGPLEVPLPQWMLWISYALILVMAIWGENDGETDSAACKIRWTTRIFLFFIVCVLTGFLFASMIDYSVKIFYWGVDLPVERYEVTEKLYEIPFITGLQGRYFLPYLPVLLMAIPGWGKRKTAKIWLVAAFIILGAAVSIRLLYGYYWT